MIDKNLLYDAEDKGYHIEKISQNESRWHYQNGEEYSIIDSVCLFDGVYLQLNDMRTKNCPYIAAEGEMDNIVSINICHSGRCETNVGNNAYIYMQQGDICVSNKMAKKDFHFPTKQYYGVEIILDFNQCIHFQEFLKVCDYPLEKFRSLAEQEPCGIYGKYDNNIFRLSEQIEKNFCDKNMHEFRACLLMLLCLLLHQDAVAEYEKVHFFTSSQIEIARQTEKYIIQNPASKITTSELAGFYGISATSLQEYFKGVFGVSISEYRLKYRMKKAAKLLTNTELKVIDVAAGVGYENPGKFAAAFKRVMGVTPLEYRRRYRLEMKENTDRKRGVRHEADTT